MSQVSSKLRRGEGRYFHYCPACDELHSLPDEWSFNGNLESPTFSPSFKHQWGTDEICHYVLTDGVLNYCGDCTHSMAGQKVPLPDIPQQYSDFLP
jgi:hypothetical protein